MMGFAGRSGSVSLSDFIGLVERNSYLPTSLHRTKHKAHAKWLPDDTLTLLFGDFNEDCTYFTLRTNDMPEFHMRHKKKDMKKNKRGSLALGWKTLSYLLIKDKMIRPTMEVQEFLGDELFYLATSKIRG